MYSLIWSGTTITYHHLPSFPGRFGRGTQPAPISGPGARWRSRGDGHLPGAPGEGKDRHGGQAVAVLCPRPGP